MTNVVTFHIVFTCIGNTRQILKSEEKKKKAHKLGFKRHRVHWPTDFLKKGHF